MTIRKLQWLAPFILISTGAIIIGLDSLPILAAVTQNTVLPTLLVKMPPDQAQHTLDSILKQQKIGVFLSPIVLMFKWLISSLTLYTLCRLLKLRASFKTLFTLISQCGFIVLFQEITIHLIIRLRESSITTFDDLVPPIGLNILFSNLSKPLFMILNYFSLFNIIWIIFLTLMLASLSKTSKTKAFIAVLPVWISPLLILLIFI